MAEQALARVTRRGQMTIPRELREALGIEPGDYVALRSSMGGVLISRASVTPQVTVANALHNLVASLGQAGEQRGIRDDEDLDSIIEDVQQRVYMAHNVGGGRAVTVREFARLMLAATGSAPEEQIPGESRMGDTRHTVSDISRIRALGWDPGVPVEQSVREYQEWLETQSCTDECLFEAERVMREQQVVQSVRVPV